MGVFNPLLSFFFLSTFRPVCLLCCFCCVMKIKFLGWVKGKFWFSLILLYPFLYGVIQVYFYVWKLLYILCFWGKFAFLFVRRYIYCLNDKNWNLGDFTWDNNRVSGKVKEILNLLDFVVFKWVDYGCNFEFLMWFRKKPVKSRVWWLF